MEFYTFSSQKCPVRLCEQTRAILHAMPAARSGVPFEAGTGTSHLSVDFYEFIGKYYTYNGATTNFPQIFASAEDVRGIQQLIDRYLAEKPYMND